MLFRKSLPCQGGFWHILQERMQIMPVHDKCKYCEIMKSKKKKKMVWQEHAVSSHTFDKYQSIIFIQYSSHFLLVTSVKVCSRKFTWVAYTM